MILVPRNWIRFPRQRTKLEGDYLSSLNVDASFNVWDTVLRRSFHVDGTKR